MKPKAPTAQYEATHAAAPTLANHTRSSPLTALRSLDRGFLALLVLFVAFAPLVTHRIYASDEIQYFSYTHSLFFDRDLDFSNQYLYFCNVDKVKFADFCRDLYGKRELATGLPINVAPIGTGLFWLPPFAVTHAGVLLARALGARVQADGFSPPYIYAITWASYAYGCAGLFLCYLLARRLFGSGLAALAVITAWLATSVIFYTVVAPPWSHATSLLTVTLFLWLWYRTRRPEGRTLKEWALLGAAAGAMMLVREQDALFMIVPAIEVAVILLVAIRIHSSRDQGSGIRDQDPPPSLTPGPRPLTLILGLATMVVIAAIVFIPQLTAYRVITGHFGPSNVVSGKFTWTSPNFLNVLFSPEHGLLPWTPVVSLGLLGLAILWRRDRLLASALGVAFLLQVYIAGSFLTWQSASSFGQRRFINSTAIVALGLAALFAWMLARGAPRWLVALLPALFVAWNAGLLMQYALWCSQQRQALDWAVVVRGQIELPSRAVQLVHDFIFNREVFYRRTKDC